MHRKAYLLLLAVCVTCLLPMYALAATYQATDAASLQAAITAASDGDTIELVGTLTDIGSVTIDKDLTITGGTVTGNSNFNAGGDRNVTFRDVAFRNISNAADNLSAIYAPGLTGTLTITDCTFADCEWDSIQVTPLAGAVISITDNVFRDDDPTVRQQRYVHIQSAMNTDFTATVTGNQMFGDLEQEALGVYYPSDPAKLQLSRNFIADTMTYPVCILNGTGENIAQVAYPLVDQAGQVRTDQVVLGKSQFYATAYPSIAAAVAAGETDLALIQDTTLFENIDFPAGTTLDLNGKTLTLGPGVTLPDTVTVEENGGQVTPQSDGELLLWVILLVVLVGLLALGLVIAAAQDESL